MIENKLKRLIDNVFNDQGYVLEFSDKTFNQFTKDSIGIELKKDLSKGKSLLQFLEQGDEHKVITLISDLIKHAEDYEYKITKTADFKKLKQIMETLSHSNNILTTNLKTEFSDSYISVQIDLMKNNLDTNPALVIGQSKELIESCFKYILDEFNDSYTKNDTLQDLRKKVFSKLSLNVRDNQVAQVDDNVKKILASFIQIVDGINNLRNEHGTGHGKSKGFVQLPKRYAELTMNAALTIVQFTWQTYKYVLSK